MLMGFIPRVTNGGQWQYDIALSIPLALIALIIGYRYDFGSKKTFWGDFGTKM